MTQILAFSGKKQSGKTTAMNFLFGSAMIDLEVAEYAHVNEYGDLVVPGETPDGEVPVVFPVESNDAGMVEYLSQTVWGEIKNYSFADMLKATAINVLGLTTEQCYGSNEDKNGKTHLRWENMPGVTTKKPIDLAWSLTEGHTEEKGFVEQVAGRLGPYYEKFDGVVYHKKGAMTARDVLQFMGTEIFRKMYSNVWVDSTLRRIVKDQPKLALLTDCRFINEVKGVQDAGGKVIRFTRGPHADEDQHESETALDNYDLKKFDYVLDNADMSIAEQNEAVFNILTEWGYIDYSDVATYQCNSDLLTA